MARTSQSNSFRVAAAAVGCFVCSTVALADGTMGESSPQHGEYSHYPNTESSSIGRSDNVESKLSAEFADFLGNEDRASRVVEGLRTGEEFRLGGQHRDYGRVEHHGTREQSGSFSGTHEHSSPPPGGGHHQNTIDPPTGTMGYGNVRLTLNLAEARLAQLGVSQPSNRELSAILVGGKIDGVEVEGILNERAAGAGWGEIAQRYDLKVGQLMGKGATAEAVTLQPKSSGYRGRYSDGEQSSSASGETDAKVPSVQSGKHVTRSNGYIPSGKAGVTSGVTAYKTQGLQKQKHAARRNGYIPSGSSAVTTAGNHGNSGVASLKGSGVRKNGYIPSGKGHAHGAGIVSASGGSLTGQSAVKSGHAKGHMKGYVPSGAGTHNAGVVSATNSSTTASVSSAGGGRGQAKGHTKHK